MTVTFLGTKGGTGTTTMTVNVGAELRRTTARPTVLVDMKAAPGDVALYLGVRPRYTLTHLLDRMAWRDPGLLSGYLSSHACGVDVLAAGDEWGRPSARDAEGLEATLHASRASHAFVIVDAGIDADAGHGRGAAGLGPGGAGGQPRRAVPAEPAAADRRGAAVGRVG